MSQVVITAVKPRGSSVTFELFGDAELTGGAGGWAELPRPRRTTATEWVGTPAKLQTLPLLLDGISGPAEASVEPQIQVVTSWGLPAAGTDEPPILTLAGPVQDGSGRWVVDDLTWGPALRGAGGARIQQDLTLVLRQYVAATVVSSPAKKARAKKKQKDKKKQNEKVKK